MKLLSIEDYVNFRCIGGDCPISCCGGMWSICVDEESAKYYRSVEGEFGDELRSKMITSEGIDYFKLKDNGDCSFLNENKLCRIYRNLGEDKMCYTCQSYPRVFYDVGDFTFCYMTNSCPEVTRMIMQRKEPMKVIFDDSDNNDVPSSDIDWVKFNRAIKAYNAGIRILQNRDLTISERLYILLFFVERFQELMREGKDTTDLTGIFSTPDVYKLMLENVGKAEVDYASKLHAFMIVFRSLIKNSYDHPMWKKCQKLADSIVDNKCVDVDAFINILSKINLTEMQIEMEQIITYRFFAVFMKGFEKSDYYEKIAYEYIILMALIGYFVLTEIEQGCECSQEDRILFYSLCNRADHAKIRKKNLEEAIISDGYYKMDQLIKLIS